MNGAEKRLRIYRALITNPEWVEVLQDALALQEKGEKQQAKGHLWLGFEWFEVHANPQTLKKMVTSRLLDITFSSHSSTNYKIADPALVREAIQAMSEPTAQPEREMPDDLSRLHCRLPWCKDPTPPCFGSREASPSAPQWSPSISQDHVPPGVTSAAAVLLRLGCNPHRGGAG